MKFQKPIGPEGGAHHLFEGGKQRISDTYTLDGRGYSDRERKHKMNVW